MEILGTFWRWKQNLSLTYVFLAWKRKVRLKYFWPPPKFQRIKIPFSKISCIFFQKTSLFPKPKIINSRMADWVSIPPILTDTYLSHDGSWETAVNPDDTICFQSGCQNFVDRPLAWVTRYWIKISVIQSVHKIYQNSTAFFERSAKVLRKSYNYIMMLLTFHFGWQLTYR